MKKKTLIILNGNQEAFQGIKVLRKLYNIVLVDLNQNCASRKLVKNFIKADIYKPKKVLSEVKKYFKKKKKDQMVHLYFLVMLYYQWPTLMIITN